MNLGDWVRANGRADAVRRLAAHQGVTYAAVTHWCNGIRRIDPLRCRSIAEFTDGQVPCHEQRPDVFGLNGAA